MAQSDSATEPQVCGGLATAAPPPAMLAEFHAAAAALAEDGPAILTGMPATKEDDRVKPAQ